VTKHVSADSSPVFVDEQGSRRRILKAAGLGVAAVLVVTLGAIGVAVAGGGVVALPGLPHSTRPHSASTAHVVSETVKSTAPTSPVTNPLQGTPQPSPAPTNATATTSPSPAPSSSTTHPGRSNSPTTRPSHGPKN
jgi:hypothetical protein